MTATTEEIRASILKESAAEREFRREMAEDVLANSPDSCFANYHRTVLDILNSLDSEAGSEGKGLKLGDEAKLANHRREGGSTGANAYGTFKVRMASEKQVRYIVHLFETRDTSNVSPKLRAETDRAAREVATGKISLRLAKDVIDTLLACPIVEGEEKMAARLTEKQENLVTKLAFEKDGALELLSTFGVNSKDDLQVMSKEDATKAIDQLFKLTNKVAAAVKTATAPQSLEDGVYMLNGDVYKVQHAQGGSGRQYAKKLVPDEFGKAHFEYAKGIIFKLTAGHKMTKAQAQEFGSLYGTCCRCGRTLSNEDSIDRMMGPVCYGKMGW